MSGRLEGKKALVTGASRGIGRGIALAYAREGADVAIGYRRDADAAASAVAEIEALGRKAYAHAADVREGDDVLQPQPRPEDAPHPAPPRLRKL